jgi:aspartate racemase
MHKVADVVAEKASLPLLHIVDVTGNAIRDRGLHCIGLLGSRFVMKEGVYQERLQKRFGIEVLVPEGDEMVAIHRIIYDELCQGRTKASSRELALPL